VYLVKQSTVLQEAAKGSQLYEHVLASIIWHEMAHLDGADERGARRAEEQLWTRFVRDGIFDQVTALRYLNALTKRPDDRLMASR
jgi:predicted SprT family Zn-dependent metalloprotease